MPLILAVSFAWSVSAQSLAKTCAAALVERGARIRGIERSRGPQTFGGTVLALENADADANDAVAPAVFRAWVGTDPDLRAAAAACALQLRTQAESLYASPRLFAAVAAAKPQENAGTADAALTIYWLSRLRLAGGTLQAAQRTELLAIEQRLDDASAQYLDASQSPGQVVIGARRLGGLSPDLLALATRAPGGAYAFPVGDATQQLLAQASSPEARQAYYLTADARLAPNVDLLERTLTLRDRAAHLLGFETWAALTLAGTPFESEAGLEKFALQTSSALEPAVRADVEAMQLALRQDQHDARYGMRPWDVERAQFLLSERAAPPTAAPADALPAVSAMYGVAFVRVEPANVWAPDVLEYRVVDAVTHRVRGIAYLDLYARPGKCARTGEITILPQRAGSHRAAAIAVLADWGPSAQSAADGVHASALYRALGGALATLLSDAPYESLEREPGGAEELAGAVTERFARPAPGPLAAYDAARAIALARIDLSYQSSGSRVDTTSIWRDAMQQALPDSYVTGTHPQTAVATFVDGDDASLFLLPWNAVYARDVGAAFGAASPPDPAVGMRFRADVIAPARTQALGDEMQAFLGRAPSPQAFFDDLGVAQP